MLLGATLSAGCATGMTGTPNGVSGTRAAVFGTVVTDVGGEVEYWVEYGTSTAYGSQTAHQTADVPKNSPRGVLVDIEGLQRSTAYHYRVCAQDSQQTGGPGCGEDRQFTTVNVDCGDTLTGDVRLSGDLNCLSTGGRNGPLVGANGITVDLGGHQIRGGSFALANSGGFDDVTIRGGTLYAIGTALVLDGASRNRIVAVGAGLRLGPFEGPSTGTGISIQGGEDNAVRHSRVEAEGAALRATNSPGLVVADSTGTAGAGSRGGGPVVSISGDLARVIRNDFTNGITVSGSNNRIVHNRVQGVIRGITVVAGQDNLVAGNDVHDTVTLVFAPEEGDGIVVLAEAVRTRLRENVATASFDDGIDVRSATTLLRDNRADDNRDFGIDAVPGVVDLGGNTASGNGNPLQCRNVFCG